MCASRFKPTTSVLRMSNANHPVTTFSEFCCNSLELLCPVILLSWVVGKAIYRDHKIGL
jgi:hypothetical protein